MSKPLLIDLPYPDITKLSKDVRVASALSQAYAGRHGELNAILQYVYHYFNFQAMNEKQTADLLMSIAVAEMKHLQIIGELLYRLGVDPIYSNCPPYRTDFYSARSVSYSKSVEKMLIDDISAEIMSAENYRKTAEKITNEGVSAVLLRLALDEELHVKELKERLKEYSDIPLVY